MAEDKQPIVIRRVYKKAGHHGGSWKVAFADFATALMAFFLLMWIIGAATEEQKEGISNYFQNPGNIQGAGGASVSAVNLGGGMDGFAAPELVGTPGPPNVIPQDMAPAATPRDDASNTQDRERLEDLMAMLKDAIASSVSIEPYKEHLLLDITPQGLRIQIIDAQFESMFDVGSANLQSHSDDILGELGALINSVPNRVSISGHTDGRSYNRRDYSNWELSSDRANAARRALIRGGMDPAKIGQVVGLGSSVLYDKADPLSPVNRRISIVVLTEAADAALLEQSPEVRANELVIASSDGDVPIAAQE